MTSLQYALVAIAVLAVVFLWWRSRKDRDLQAWNPTSEQKISPIHHKAKSEDLRLEGSFDEFGVSRPRTIGEALHSAMGGAMGGAMDTRPADMPELPPLEEKIIGLLVTGDRDIPGPRLHQMLQQEGLQYDDKTRVYHRFDDAGGRVFSVANVLKPGDLNPEQAVRFSTPGLSMFLVLPVAVDPFVAFEDFIETATRLAQNLHVGVYDLRRQVLDNAHTQALYQEIVQWSQGSQADDPNAQPAD